jgi:hypothetical protein
MPTVLILFWLLLATCCIFAAVAGGRTGRIGAGLQIAAVIATWHFELSIGWASTNVPVMIIDVMLLVGFYSLALRSKAYWPIWAAGFHLLTVAGHIASMIMPDFRLGIYWRFSGIWSILVMMTMIVGISLDRSRWRQPDRIA